ncbi:MAG: hypothetical protein SH821_09875 [Phototrophicales bacterium]|nr:hypothetical protein [Phototrophicales bacterium]
MGISIAIRLGVIHIIHQMIEMIISKIKAEAAKIEGIMSTITGSYMQKLESWQGTDADAFRNEVNNRLNRQLESLKNTILQIPKGIGDAEVCMVNADNKAATEAQKLADIFKNIYR